MCVDEGQEKSGKATLLTKARAFLEIFIDKVTLYGEMTQ